MKGIARVGDAVVGGVHCHGHSHGPMPTPGTITQGSPKVFSEGIPVTRAGDLGHSDACCGKVGKIEVIGSQQKVYVQGKSVVGIGSPTLHCDMAPGQILTGSSKVSIP